MSEMSDSAKRTRGAFRIPDPGRRGLSFFYPVLPAIDASPSSRKHLIDRAFGELVDQGYLVKDEQLNAIDTELGNIVTQQVLDEAYYNAYGLNEGVDTNNPLNLVLMRPKEDTESHQPLFNSVRRFCKHAEFFNKIGLGLLEFLQLPRPLVEELFEISTTSNLEKERLVNELERSAKGK